MAEVNIVISDEFEKFNEGDELELNENAINNPPDEIKRYL